MNLYKYLLQKKHSDYIEIEIHLHERCNISCIFCCQNHNGPLTNKEDLLIKLELVKEFIKKQTLNKYVINLMGGELFSDDIDDSLINLYKWFISELKSLLHGKEVKFGITTNLIFTKTERILNLIKELKKEYDFSLGVSYDSKLRSWTQFQLECVYKPNIELFKPYISTICSVLHSHTIKFLLKQEDIYLTYLYNIRA